jgi:IS30 family transposase
MNIEEKGQIPDRKLTGTRPKIVDEKVRAGDWENDTMEGAGKTAYIATFVDKTTKLLRGKTMPDKTAASLNKAAFRSIPDENLKTLTAGNGKEFSGHKALSRDLRCGIYFAHPYHSWKRGLNEHTNGLIRQYLPKGTSLPVFMVSKDSTISKISRKLVLMTISDIERGKLLYRFKRQGNPASGGITLHAA